MAKKIILPLTIVVVVLGVTALLLSNSSVPSVDGSDEFMMPEILEPTARLYLEPGAASLTEGGAMEFVIMLDTGGREVDGVDAHLSYTVTSLTVSESIDTSRSSFQLFPQTRVDAQQGVISVAALATPGMRFSGVGEVARFTVHAQDGVDNGSEEIVFRFEPNNTTDSNVAAQGQDVLQEVGNATITLAAGA